MDKKPFFFRQGGHLKKLDIDKIIYLEAAKNYLRLYTSERMFVARISLDAAMVLLPENKFLRVHRSFAVAADHIDVVARDAVKLKNLRLEVPVSRMYYVALTKQVIILDTAAIEATGTKLMKSRRKKVRD